MVAHPDLPARFLAAWLEHYFLWCIGELEAEWAVKLAAAEVQLATALHQQGTWQEVLSARMGFEPGLAESVRELWARNRAIAETRGTTLGPREFASGLVRANFPSLSHDVEL